VPSPRAASFRQWGIVIFIVAFAVRVLHVLELSAAPLFGTLLGDARAYDAWALRLAAGGWVGHDVFYQAPLYPYLLGLVYAFAGRDLLLVRIGQAALGSLACVLVGLAGARLFSSRVGMVAGLMLALYGPAIFFDALLQKSVVDGVLVCLLLWLIARVGEEQGTARTWLALGLTLGALGLTRENAAVFIIVILVWVLGRSRVPRRTRFANAGALAAGLVVVLAPVAARNAWVGGGFVITTSQLGPNLYIGNNPRADGTYAPLRFGRGDAEHEREDATRLAERAEGRALTPSEVSRYWRGRALAFASEQPGEWLALTVRKIALLWNVSEMLDTESQETHADWSTTLWLTGAAGHFGVLVPLALLGVLVTWAERSRLAVFYALLLSYAASVVVFYVFARYRYPLVPFLVLLASAGLVGAPAAFRSWSSRRRVLAVALVAVAAIAGNRPMLSADRMRAITETNLGAAYQSDGDLETAVEQYRRALAVDAGHAPAYSNLGSALRAQGRADEARDAFRRAIEIEPDYADAHFNLANGLAAAGRPHEAVSHYRRALTLVPDAAEFHTNLAIALDATGGADEAIGHFREAVRLDPGAARPHRNLANALAARGEVDEALTLLRRAIELDPSDAGLHYDRGLLSQQQGSFDEAIASLHRALELRPAWPEAHNDMGIALASRGRVEEAIEEFRRALALRPEFEQARRNLEMARGPRRP
jgi:tetratricopeptide (TPR) repeat protein